MLHDLDGNYRTDHAFHSQVQALANNRWLERAANDLRCFMHLLRDRQLREHELPSASSPFNPAPRAPHMLNELRAAAMRQPGERGLRSVVAGCKRLLSQRGKTNSMPIAKGPVERIDQLDGWQLDAFFAYPAHDLSPDPKAVLAAAQRYAEQRDAPSLITLVQTSELSRQELLRRLELVGAPAGKDHPAKTMNQR